MVFFFYHTLPAVSLTQVIFRFVFPSPHSREHGVENPVALHTSFKVDLVLRLKYWIRLHVELFLQGFIIISVE